MYVYTSSQHVHEVHRGDYWLGVFGVVAWILGLLQSEDACILVRFYSIRSWIRIRMNSLLSSSSILILKDMSFAIFNRWTLKTHTTSQQSFLRSWTGNRWRLWKFLDAVAFIAGSRGSESEFMMLFRGRQFILIIDLHHMAWTAWKIHLPIRIIHKKGEKCQTRQTKLIVESAGNAGHGEFVSKFPDFPFLVSGKNIAYVLVDETGICEPTQSSSAPVAAAVTTVSKAWREVIGKLATLCGSASWTSHDAFFIFILNLMFLFLCFILFIRPELVTEKSRVCAWFFFS